MRSGYAIFKRDLRSLFCVATGPIVAALFACLCGIAFASGVFDQGGIATMRPVFDFSSWLLLLLCPAITMRLIAEERRVGTWDLLLASPISSFQLAKGKFVAAWVFLLFVLFLLFFRITFLGSNSILIVVSFRWRFNIFSFF